MAGTISSYYATTLTGLTGASNLSIHGGGTGVVATTDGVSGTADFVLPAAVDETGKFRCCLLIEYNGDNVRNFTLQLRRSAGNFASGIRFRVSAGNLLVDVGGTQITSFAATSGNKYWCSVMGDGSRVTVSFHTFDSGGYRTTSGTQDSELHVETTDYNLSRNSVTTWDVLDRVTVTTLSTSTKFLGCFVNAGGWEGPSGQPEVNGLSMIRPTINSDTNTLIMVPKGYTGATDMDWVQVGHPNANDYFYGFRPADADAGAAFAYIRRQGYLMCAIRGDNSSLTAANASEWGAPNGVAMRKALSDYVRANFEGLRRMYWIGQSMGALTGYGYERVYPGEITALASISGVGNLAYSYDSEGFAATIRTAYSAADDAAWQLIESTHDPIQNPSRFATLPIKIWFGSSDVTLSKTKHATDFETAVDAAGGNVEIVDAGAVGHLASACYDGAAIVSFFQANTTSREAQSGRSGGAVATGVQLLPAIF